MEEGAGVGELDAVGVLLATYSNDAVVVEGGGERERKREGYGRREQGRE